MKLEKFKNFLKYINILYVILVIFTFFKLAFFTSLVNSEMNIPIQNSQFGWNKFIISYSFCAIAFFSVALVFNGKKSLKILIGLDIFLSVFMYANLIYFRSFDSYLSIYNLEQYRNFGVVGASALALIQFKDILLFFDPIILGFTYKFWRKKAEAQQKLTTRQNILVAIFPIVCIGLALNYNRFFNPTITKIEAAAKLSIIGHQYYDLSSYIKDSKETVVKNDVRDSIETWFAKKNEKQGQEKNRGIFKDKNLVVVQVESLENFAINLKVENQEVTPTLNGLLKDSLYFNKVVAQENGGNSSDADFMINTSLLPLKSGSVGYRFPNNKYNSLPVILRNQGYNSSEIHSGEGYFWNKENFLPYLGFDSYTDIQGMKVKKEDMFFMGLKDEEHLSQVADKAMSLKDKYYLHTVTETSHTPFEMPKDMKYLKLSKKMDNNIFGKYFQSIRYTDDAIKKFLEKMDKSGELDNTVVVFYGDHEGIHKYNNDSVLSEQYSEYKKYNNNNEVPLIVYSKGYNKGKTISKVGGQIDMMPTILSLLDVDEDIYKNTAMGVNLLSNKEGYAIDRNGTIYGKYANERERKNIRKSIAVSEKIIMSDYFSKYYRKSDNFTFNGKLKKLD